MQWAGAGTSVEAWSVTSSRHAERTWGWELISAVGNAAFGYVSIWDAAKRRMGTIGNLVMPEARTQSIPNSSQHWRQNLHALDAMTSVYVSGHFLHVLIFE